MLKVLFVCKDNITRSVAAKLAIEKFAEQHGAIDIIFDSAGINPGNFDKVYTAHFEELQKLGIDTSVHKQKFFEKGLVDNETTVVAMGIDLKKYIEENFHIPCVLFSSLAYNTDQSIKIDWQKSEKEVQNQLRQMVREFYKVAPKVIENLRLMAKKNTNKS